MPKHGSTNSKKLSAKHFAVIKALAMGATHQDAAIETGVGIDTIRKWRLQPLFGQALNEALEETRTHALDQLKGHVAKATDYLGRCASQRDLNSVGVKAAEAILDRVGLSVERVNGDAPAQMLPGDRGAVIAMLRTLPAGFLREALLPVDAPQTEEENDEPEPA